jgi:hypothetical protein
MSMRSLAAVMRATILPRDAYKDFASRLGYQNQDPALLSHLRQLTDGQQLTHVHFCVHFAYPNYTGMQQNDDPLLERVQNTVL